MEIPEWNTVIMLHFIPTHFSFMCPIKRYGAIGVVWGGLGYDHNMNI